MIGRVLADRQRRAETRRADRLAAVLIALVQAGVAAWGWLAAPVGVAVAIAAQLLLGGIAAVFIIGPARHELGLARYAMPSVAGISATLFGRLLPGGQSLLLVPIVAVLLWAVIYLELRIERGTGGATIHNLLLMAIVFCGGAGLLVFFGAQSWPTPMLLVSALTIAPAMRAAEAREVLGVESVGQALLHVLVVTQVGLASTVLGLQPTITAGLMALAFYTWAGAAESLRAGAPGRSVAVEYGALLLVGLLVALLMHRS